MPILIDRVRIYNFRSLQKCEVLLSPETLLIGSNNSGKTSFLRALNLALGVGAKKITKEDFHIGEGDNDNSEEKEIIIDVHIIPIDSENKQTDSFEEAWTEKFGELLNFDTNDKSFFAFRTTIKYNIFTGDYSPKRYKINDWGTDENWETREHIEKLNLPFDSFPLFFIDAQRDIVKDLRERTSYLGKMIGNLTIKESAVITKIEKQIKENEED